MFFHYYDDDYIKTYPVQTNGDYLADSDYPSGESEQDIRRISAFLDDVKYFLWRLVKHKPAFIKDSYDDVVAAWKSSKQHFGTAKQALLDELRKGADQFVSRLEAFGLLASELKLKLKLRNVEHWFGELISTPSEKALPKFFASINNLLDSLLEALGVHKAIVEIKDAIRDALV